MASETSIPSEELRAEISRNYIPLPEDLPWAAFRTLLSAHIGKLLATDFHQLVSLLYRVDVEETKLKRLLQTRPGEDAADLITTLVIARIQEKMESRRRFTPPQPKPGAAESW